MMKRSVGMTNAFGKRFRLIKVGTITLIWIAAILAETEIHAQTNTGEETTLKKTLVIASHPYPDKSVINKALWQTVQELDGVVYRNLESLYGNDINGIDVEAERKAYDGIDRVVYMYPIHWFNLTPMLKAYFNQVWYQWAPKTLEGKEMLVVVTAGADEKAYSHEGRIGSTMEEILTPMKVCSKYVGMEYLEPLTFLGVGDADEATIHSYQDQLAERLKKAD
ncbi:glutathione-regulated potassium-efflux system ancillary protein KefF [Salegentibacter sp. 24]|uniref:NAD(P)H-dependent oxidoreductase n=1 Tax=Salegentibacter sp. 24 TaxID=2183986 RepID=UPI0010D3285C|nr:NAD(P)H-dependent oxidoreductase [Salegentibacter sp. 24]TDN79346.1 glutathione-regulated potassium-efflux system ancillary protein KefF [Salegentibacter sp. 24]